MKDIDEAVRRLREVFTQGQAEPDVAEAILSVLSRLTYLEAIVRAEDEEAGQ